MSATSAAPQTKHFWCGSHESSPIQNVTLGGVSFPRFSERVKYDEKQNKTLRSQYAGNVVELDAEQEKRVREAMGRKVVRWSTSGLRGWMLDSSSPRYRKHPGDKPASAVVYFQEVQPGFTPAFSPPMEEKERERAEASEAAARREDKEDAKRRKEMAAKKRENEVVDDGGDESSKMFGG